MADTVTDIDTKFITAAITEFYKRAFCDPIIGHFFFKLDHSSLIKKQINFSSSMLGLKNSAYTGKPLAAVHKKLGIRKPHFLRRMVLMEDVLKDLGLADNLRDMWISKEKKLMDKIVC